MTHTEAVKARRVSRLLENRVGLFRRHDIADATSRHSPEFREERGLESLKAPKNQVQTGESRQDVRELVKNVLVSLH